MELDANKIEELKTLLERISGISSILLAATHKIKVFLKKSSDSERLFLSDENNALMIDLFNKVSSCNVPDSDKAEILTELEKYIM